MPRHTALPAILALARPRLSEALTSPSDSPVFYYQLTSKNDSRAVSPEPRKFTYHSDLHLPWPALQVALEHVVGVGGRRRAFRFRAFPF